MCMTRCSAEICCSYPATTTIMTTTPLTCVTFRCPFNNVKRPMPETLVCTGECEKEQCCEPGTTTPKTCAGFRCPIYGSLKPMSQTIVCNGPCDSRTCCMRPTTTPLPTTTPATCAA